MVVEAMRRRRVERSAGPQACQRQLIYHTHRKYVGVLLHFTPLSSSSFSPSSSSPLLQHLPCFCVRLRVHVDCDEHIKNPRSCKQLHAIKRVGVKPAVRERAVHAHGVERLVLAVGQKERGVKRQGGRAREGARGGEGGAREREARTYTHIHTYTHTHEETHIRTRAHSTYTPGLPRHGEAHSR